MEANPMMDTDDLELDYDLHEFAAAGNEAFARIWDTPGEDAAWAHLQGDAPTPTAEGETIGREP
jgi:hypothetical protein